MKRIFWPALLVLTTAFGYWAIFTPWFHEGIGAQLLLLYGAFHPIGAFWMIYMSLRFEKKPVPYVLLAFVPYSFLWYYFERVRPGIPRAG